jgi:hypothetical protein
MDENDNEFTPAEMRIILFSPPVRLNSVSSCVKHRETLTLGLEQYDKVAIDTCLASLLNTCPKGCIDAISESCLGKIVCKIALATPVTYTLTAKRLAMILLTEWMRVIRNEHNAQLKESAATRDADQPTNAKRKDRAQSPETPKRRRSLLVDAHP